MEALEDIISLGFTRLLTSGGGVSALLGANTITECVNKVYLLLVSFHKIGFTDI